MGKKPVSNKLKATSLKWAMKGLAKYGDTDLFPRPFEIDVIKTHWSKVQPDLSNIDISNHQWQPPRKLAIPKAELSFRSICQLDPIDSLLFLAIMKEVGRSLESIRDTASNNRVFGHRFNPTTDGNLYGRENSWRSFWVHSHNLTVTSNAGWVAAVDVMDFYNQIYHHRVENELLRARIPSPHRNAILALLDKASQGTSRGLPIGPHPTHLLAELALCALDELLVAKKVRFCRNVDDIHIFCKSQDEAKVAIYWIAEELSTHGLALNERKTKVRSIMEHIEMCERMVADQPINDAENEILEILREHSDGDDYDRITLADLDAEELAHFSEDVIGAVIDAYLAATPVPYERLRWFLRRLCQSGAPGGVCPVVRKITSLTPVLGDAAAYLISASDNYEGEWEDIGAELLAGLELPIVQANRYLRGAILSLFSRIVDLDHFDQLSALFDNIDPIGRRKIILAATAAGATPWVRLLKDRLDSFSPWERRAVMASTHLLEPSERKHWHQRLKKDATPLERIILESKP